MIAVTVGIPFFDGERTLADAIRSVFAQTFEDWELILVDDGSSDASLEIAKTVADPRVRVVSDGINRGLQARLNQIARLARGTYLARMDADDVMHPDRLRIQAEFMESHPEVDVVGSAIYALSPRNEVLGARSLGSIDTRPGAVLRGVPLVHPSVMGRREWFLANPYDETGETYLRSEDHELWARTCRSSRFAKIERPLVYYRENAKPPLAYLKDYLRSERSRRRIYLRYGPRFVGLLGTACLLAVSHVKGATYRAATTVGLQSALVRARSGRLSPEEAATARKGLDQVLTAEVAGLTEPARRTESGIRLVHTTTVPKSLGFLSAQLRYLNARGFEVHVVSSPGKEMSWFAAQEQVAAHSLRMTRGITPPADAVAFFRMAALLRRIRPVIVHAHTPKAGLVGMAAAWAARVPVRVYTIHGLPMLTASGLKRRLLKWSERVACRLAHQVLCVSPSVMEVAIEERICPGWKVKVLVNGSINGVECRERFNPERSAGNARERFGIPADAPVVGFVGRIVRDKGLLELVEAWKTLREDHPAMRLLVVGEFEPQDPVPAETRRVLVSDDRIVLPGQMDDVAPAYAAMDVLALPSYREGLPLVPLEASAMKLPVVATRIPGCTDAVQDGVTGTLVPARDSRALAEAIRAYLADPDLRRRHGEAGRRRVESEFKPQDLWRAVHREYERLLEERGVGRSDE